MHSVSVVMPVLMKHAWQVPMTECALETLFLTTSVKFELVVVQAGEPTLRDHTLINRYVHVPVPTGNVTAEVNLGLEEATGEFTVYTGNDLFMRPGWLEALLACFDHDHRCGVATLMPSEHRHQLPYKDIREGFYGPLMMFRSGWRFDAETFPTVFADTDLCMQMYREGLRSYRNGGVTIHHLLHQTMPPTAEEFHGALTRFRAKHGSCGLFAFRAFSEGILW